MSPSTIVPMTGGIFKPKRGFSVKLVTYLHICNLGVLRLIWVQRIRKVISRLVATGFGSKMPHECLQTQMPARRRFHSYMPREERSSGFFLRSLALPTDDGGVIQVCKSMYHRAFGIFDVLEIRPKWLGGHIGSCCFISSSMGVSRRCSMALGLMR